MFFVCLSFRLTETLAPQAYLPRAPKPRGRKVRHGTRTRARARARVHVCIISCCAQRSGARTRPGPAPSVSPALALPPPLTACSRFVQVIIDEAAQSTELTTLIPLQHGCERLILLGDEKQLSATVFSDSGCPLRRCPSLSLAAPVCENLDSPRSTVWRHKKHRECSHLQGPRSPAVSWSRVLLCGAAVRACRYEQSLFSRFVNAGYETFMLETQCVSPQVLPHGLLLNLTATLIQTTMRMRASVPGGTARGCFIENTR